MEERGPQSGRQPLSQVGQERDVEETPVADEMVYTNALSFHIIIRNSLKDTTIII